jgi:hypothetical protein
LTTPQKAAKKRHLVLDTAEQDVITPLTSGAHKTPHGFRNGNNCLRSRDARIAQLVEQRIENPRVGGSNPPPGTIFFSRNQTIRNRALNIGCYNVLQSMPNDLNGCSVLPLSP